MKSVGRAFGSVHLVGAGPGAPDLLTRRGLERLRAADVVLFDRLVSRELLDEAPARALRIDVGKVPGPHPTGASAPVTQEVISELLVEHARAGLVVVRLKGGDPFVFGRGAEELDACRAAGIPCEIVPGLSSAIAAPALAGIAVTERGVARSFSVVTARHGRTTAPESGNGASVPPAPPTTADTRVVLMGVAELPSIVAGLLAEGLAPSTPAALVASASLDNQRALHSNLGEIVVATRRAGIEPPAVLIVGAAAGRARPIANAPLAGFTVALTRPDDAARRTRALLAPTGARVVGSPLIDIEYREDPNALNESDRNLSSQLRRADWIAFTSRHGVEGLWRALERRGLDARALAGNRLAVVGPGTAEALERRGLRADLVAEPHRARALVDALTRVSPSRVLFAGGSRARRELVDGLAGHGIATDERIVYDTLYRPPSSSFRRELENGVDAVIFASPSAARSYELQGLPARSGGKWPIAICLGPTTADAARGVGGIGGIGVKAGFRAVAVATRHDDLGLIETLIEQLTSPPAPSSDAGPVGNTPIPYEEIVAS